MFCEKCGTDNESGSVHCAKCGAVLSEPEKPTDKHEVSASVHRDFRAELKRFNLGAFILNWIWCIAHRQWLFAVVTFSVTGLYVFLMLFAPGIRHILFPGPVVPLIVLILLLYLGCNGNELAWKSRKFESVKQFKDTQRIWGISSAVVCLIMLFYLFVIFTEVVMKAKDRAYYASCREALMRVKTAEDMYKADNGRYSIQPQGRELAVYMVPGCEKAYGSDCPGEVMESMDRSCVAGSFKISGTAESYRITGIAIDRAGCKICVSPNGYSPRKHDPNGACKEFSCP